MQAWLATSLPRAVTTVGRTSFQVCIWMARMARHTQSCTLTGLGPGAYFLSSNSSWLRSPGKSASETCAPRSYVILESQCRQVYQTRWPWLCTLPLRVVAAKSCASASVEVCRMDNVVVHASFCGGVSAVIWRAWGRQTDGFLESA